MIPRYEFIDPALLMAVDDGGERAGQIGLQIDFIRVEFHQGGATSGNEFLSAAKIGPQSQ
jgi:hypothetical protein